MLTPAARGSTPAPAKRSRGPGGSAGAAAGTGGDGYAGGTPVRTQSSELLAALRRLAGGDFDVHLAEAGDTLWVEIAHAFNNVVETNRNVAVEFSRISRTVGREGRAQDRAHVPGARGSYAAELDSLNSLVIDLTQPTTEVARVLSAVAEGDLSQKMVLEIDGKSVQGEFLRIGTTVNTMVDQLSSFASEVTRVAR
ncbi:MAG: HAMP domain-containing protein, partial [Longimicrobiales bacterium]